MEQSNVSADATVSKLVKRTLILKFTFKQPLMAPQSPFFRNPALMSTTSESVRSEKCFKTQPQG